MTDPYKVVERGPEEPGGYTTLYVVYSHPDLSGRVNESEQVEFAVTSSSEKLESQRHVMSRIADLGNRAFQNGWNCREYSEDADKVFSAYGKIYHA